MVDQTRVARERRALAAAPELTYLFWEATRRCNLRCRHCGSSCEVEAQSRELSTEEILRIVHEIAEDFDAGAICCAITGGEPLLRRDLETVVQEMSALALEAGIVTNGSFLDAERARSLVDAGLLTVSVSLDGREAEHDAIRGAGSFRSALAAMQHAASVDLHVEAITCVRPANLAGLSELERQVRDAGAEDWRLITIDRMGRVAGDKDPHTWLEPAAAEALLDFVAARRRALRDDEHFEVSFSCGGYLGPRREAEVRDRGSQCYAGLAIGGILADGQVSACPSLPRYLAQGSALERRFGEIWREGFAVHRDLDAMRRQEPCSDCDWYNLCLGGGLHERLAQPDDFCWLKRQHP